MNIPFNKSVFVGSELSYVQDVIKRGHTSGDGFYTKICNNLFEKEIGVKKSLLTTSCTHALEMVALLLNIKPGDEVILPSFTFVSTVNAFINRGATPIFVDIKYSTLNINEDLIENSITEKTKAIIVVHYAGVSCKMDKINKLSKKYDLSIVEDNAHGLFGKYKNKYLGAFGTFSTQSFHETKNFSCGEGGSLFINDPNYIERAEIIREKGTNRSKFIRNEVEKYSWVDIGSSYLLSEFNSAILYAQLEKRKIIQKKRKEVWNFYYKNLKSWAINQEVQLPIIPTECDQAYHIFYMLMPSKNKRNKLINHLKQKGLSSSFHYVPLHNSEMGKKYGYKNGDLPVTEKVSNCILRLPIFYCLDLNQINFNYFYEF